MIAEQAEQRFTRILSFSDVECDVWSLLLMQFIPQVSLVLNFRLPTLLYQAFHFSVKFSKLANMLLFNNSQTTT